MNKRIEYAGFSILRFTDRGHWMHKVVFSNPSEKDKGCIFEGGLNEVYHAIDNWIEENF